MAGYATLLLDTAEWDLVIDASGNIALATPPYSLAQDSASAIKTFSDGGPNFTGEVYFDDTLGVPWLTQILGHAPSLPLLKQQFADAAMTVPGVASATAYVSSFNGRTLTGQVQVMEQGTTNVAAANFAVSNPQGSG